MGAGPRVPPHGDFSTATQVSLPEPAKVLMGGGWVMLENKEPVHVEDGEVSLLDPNA